MNAPETRAIPRWVALGRRAVRVLPRGRYPLMSWLCRRPGRPFVSPLDVTRRRLSFVCDLGDAIAREACFMGHYEPQETVVVRSLLGAGGCFVDVGANWGYFTLLAADLVGPAGRVVALEPHPSLFAALEENVGRNRLTRVTPLRVAAADRDGEMNLAGFGRGVENSGVSRLTDEPDPSTPNFNVPTRLLETVLDEHGVGPVDLLKMDIEGGEGLVLPTLAGGLSSGRYRRILLELHPAALARRGQSAAGLVEMLLGYGYRGWRIDHSRAAFRRAAYRLPPSPESFLLPLDPAALTADWPHVLFCAPGVAAPPGGEA
ncbi:MAG: FkbM family methyltransferase [Pyrinomonadaceae bacterium]